MAAPGSDQCAHPRHVKIADSVSGSVCLCRLGSVSGETGDTDTGMGNYTGFHCYCYWAENIEYSVDTIVAVRQMNDVIPQIIIGHCASVVLN